MKKIIKLLFSVGAFATSFAQSNHRQNNDDCNKRNDQYATANGQYNKHDRDDRDLSDKENSSYARERSFQIDKINHDFDYRINAIQNDRYMRRHEKKMAIRNAEIERARQIQILNATTHDRSHDDYGKHDNNTW